MKLSILNREFQHPNDGWYQIEVPGEHLNAESGVMQVIDDKAVTSIVNRFNQEADGYEAQHSTPWPGMLIDHEHFKHDPDKETIAYGWLMRLENRKGKPFGQIRWTNTGKPAIDGGDYRFFSSEYDPKDLQILNRGAKPVRVRPLRLDGLTLTNDPNNKGGAAITNRQGADAQCPDCGGKLNPVPDSTDKSCPACKKNFAVSREPADSTAKQNIKNKKMKTVCTLLGLSADADESSVHAAVTKLQNRVSTLEPLETENKTLKNRITEVDSASVDSLLVSHGVKEEKILNRLKPVILATPTADRAQALVDFGYKLVEAKPASQPRVLNRGQGKPEEVEASGDDEQAKTEKIRNRANELTKGGMKFDAAWAKAVIEINNPVTA
jgi:phage I-like protein